jgi:tripartite ATP-independent transporter DctP family solute receptor
VVAAGLLLATGGALGQQLRLRIGHDQPPKSMYDEGHTRFRDLVEQRSGGRIKVDVYPGGTLGSEVVMLEGVRLGSLDGSVAHVANASTIVPELALFSLPYLFKDSAHYERVLADPKFQSRIDELVAARQLGIKVAGYYSAGVRVLYTRRGPATTPEGLRGTKIRVMNNPVEAKVWNAFGTIPTPMNFGEVYQALQSGVLDAAENAPAVIEANRHYEAAKTVILTEHQRSVCLLVLNERKLQRMPAELQKLVLGAAREAAVYERQRDAELNAQAIERMKAKGVQVVVPEQARFAARAAAIQDEVASSLKVGDLLELIRAHAAGN